MPESQSRPAIPAKRYFPVDEVERLCSTSKDVLQMLEVQLWSGHHLKGRGVGYRRFYQHHEVLQLRRLIQQLKTHDGNPLAVMADTDGTPTPLQNNPDLWTAEIPPSDQHIDWMAVRAELLQIRSLLSDVESLPNR